MEATVERRSPKEWLLHANEVTGEIHLAYPPRETPNPHVPTRTAVLALLKSGVSPARLVRAAKAYGVACEREGTPPKYRIGSTRFFRDGIWQQYDVATVYGLTRAEWIRTGQDVAIFDQLLESRHGP